MEKRAVPRAHRADGVAVIRAAERQEQCPFRFTALHARLEDHLQRRFHGGGTVVGKEDLVVRKAGRFDQFRSQRRSDVVGQAEKRAVREPVELLADGLVDLGPPMAVQIGPDRGIAIEVFAALIIAQHRAFPGNQDDGIMTWRVPVAHLGEGVPDVGLVRFSRISRHCYDNITC